VGRDLMLNSGYRNSGASDHGRRSHGTAAALELPNVGVVSASRPSQFCLESPKIDDLYQD
jgi:hypothetical protein